jgi:hypothetical protein
VLRDKTSSSQAAWALLTEGVSQARILAHRIRHLSDRSRAAAEESDERDLVYRVMGDAIEGIPGHLDGLETALDRTSYALSKMGEEFLKGRIPLDDRYEVDEAVKAVPGFAPGQRRKSSAPCPARVAQRHMVRGSK